MSQLQHVGLLESLKYRMNQLIDSIGALQYLLHNNNAPAMPSWPDILARYNLLLSQIHALFNALSYAPPHAIQSQQQQQSPQQQNNPKALQNLVVYPAVLLTQHQLDHGLQQLFRTSQTPEVLNEEDSIVRRTAAILKTSTSEGVPLHPGPEGCIRVVNECAEIKQEHDARVQRAVRAVTLLRDKYDWHARVEANGVVEEEEGEGGEEEGGEESEGEGEGEGGEGMGEGMREGEREGGDEGERGGVEEERWREGEGEDFDDRGEHASSAIDAEMVDANNGDGATDIIPHDPPSSANVTQVDRDSEASTPSPPSVQSNTNNETNLIEAMLDESNSASQVNERTGYE